MPLDHFVPQTHLRQFTNDAGKFYVFWKSDGSHFESQPKSVCAIQGGSTNKFCEKERILEEKLSTFEQEYPQSVEKIKNKKVDDLCIDSLSGFLAGIIAASPEYARRHAPFLEYAIKQTPHPIPKEALEEIGKLHPPEDGKIKFEPNLDFIKASDTRLFKQLKEVYKNVPWEIIHNMPEYESPFFTSDCPVCTHENQEGINQGCRQIIAPLTPLIAIRLTLPSKGFTCKEITAKKDEVRKINKIIVQNAKDKVICSENHYWAKDFILKNNSHISLEINFNQ